MYVCGNYMIAESFLASLGESDDGRQRMRCMYDDCVALCYGQIAS